MYGTVFGAFSSFRGSFYTLFGTLRGQRPFLEELLSYNKTLTTLLFISYVSIVHLAVTGLIIAVLGWALKQAKRQVYYNRTIDMQDYEMMEFLLKRLKLWIGLTKPKPVSIINDVYMIC